MTCGEDGLARMWDVREAALKRYGDIIGYRSDYILPEQKAIKENTERRDNDDAKREIEQGSSSVPGIPLHLPTGDQSSAPDTTALVRPPHDIDRNVENNLIPAMPQEAEGIRLGANFSLAVANENRVNPGEFVANDEIDEGVILLAQLQHGTFVDENQQQGPGTRARRKAVKVMCIARCPVGGHFATGSDDGLGRVWADDDDQRIESADSKLREFDIKDKTADPKVAPLFIRNKMSARQQAVLGPLNGAIYSSLNICLLIYFLGNSP